MRCETLCALKWNRTVFPPGTVLDLDSATVASLPPDTVRLIGEPETAPATPEPAEPAPAAAPEPGPAEVGPEPDSATAEVQAAEPGAGEGGEGTDGVRGPG